MVNNQAKLSICEVRCSERKRIYPKSENCIFEQRTKSLFPTNAVF